MDAGPYQNLPLHDAIWLRMYYAALSRAVTSPSQLSAAAQADIGLAEYERRFGTVKRS